MLFLFADLYLILAKSILAPNKKPNGIGFLEHTTTTAQIPNFLFHNGKLLTMTGRLRRHFKPIQIFVFRILFYLL